MTLQAFIVQLLHQTGDSIHGRVQLQKLVYFCKAMGADVNAYYKLYIYGPYSQQVANALQDCVLDDILVESDGIIRKGTEFNSFLSYIDESGNTLSEHTKKIIQDVLTLCEPLNTKELEITATTFFIARQQRALFEKIDQKEVVDKVTAAKKTRFTEHEINESYQRVIDEWLPLEKKYCDI